VLSGMLNWLKFLSIDSQTKRKSVTQSCDEKSATPASDEKSETADAEAKDEGQEEKRRRTDETTNSTACESEPVATPTVQKAAPPPRCNQCRQLLDDPDLRLYPGDHCDAVRLVLMFLAGCLGVNSK